MAMNAVTPRSKSRLKPSLEIKDPGWTPAATGLPAGAAFRRRWDEEFAVWPPRNSPSLKKNVRIGVNTKIVVKTSKRQPARSSTALKKNFWPPRAEADGWDFRDIRGSGVGSIGFRPGGQEATRIGVRPELFRSFFRKRQPHFLHYH